VQNLENQIIWFGADPGGQNSFGTAILHQNGSFETGITSYTDETMQWLLTRVEEQKLTPVSAGIDAPLWWSSGRAGERKVDRILHNLDRKLIMSCHSIIIIRPIRRIRVVDE
jgi:hypothetical protein